MSATWEDNIMRSALRNNIVKLLFAALFAVAVPLGFALGFSTNIHPILIIICPLVRVSLVFVIKIINYEWALFIEINKHTKINL